jgi:hypothetical protein
VDRIARLDMTAMRVVESIGLGIRQMTLDIPHAVIAKVAFAGHGSDMQGLARTGCGKGHVRSSVIRA